MTTQRSFTNAFEMVDYTDAIISVPNQWGLIRELGIFRSEGVAQNSVTVESINGTLGIIGDKVRGERNNVSKDDTRTLRAYAIPHFNLDDAVYPQDIQGKRAYGSDQVETFDAVMARKLARLRRSHAATLEAARAHAITTGTVYAPNGTVSGNYYTDFGVTRKEIDFVFGTTTTDLLAKSEEGIAHIQDNILTGENITGVVVLCSPTFFSKLIAHNTTKEAFKYYTSTQEPLRNRLGGMSLYRTFVYGNVTYVEYRGSYNGTALIPAGDAYMIPQGTEDMFVSYFGPANKFDLVNTVGEEAYAFMYPGATNESYLIQTESNHLHFVRRPQSIVRLYSTT